MIAFQRCIVLLAVQFSVLLSAALVQAQPIYHLYGITPLQQLVEIDLTGPPFQQRVVGNVQFSNLKGLEYDSTNDRALAISENGILVELNQSTAAATVLQDFSSMGGDQAQFLALALDVPGPSRKLFVAAPGFPNLILQFQELGPVYDATTVFQFGPRMVGASVRSSDGLLFALDQTNNFISIVNKNTGVVLNSLSISGAQGVAGIAFHPTDHTLFGVTSTGTLLRINAANGVATTLMSYPGNNAVATSDLAFLRVTPTPSPTPTVTPTFTPTAAPTATPTPSCLNGGGPCGCNAIEIRLNDGSIQCGPVDTLSKATKPEVPTAQVRGNTVTLLFEAFSAVTDGKSVVTLPLREALFAGDSLLKNFFSASARSPSVSIRYEARVNRTKSKIQDIRTKVTKRNQVSFRSLPPGRYNAKYRVNIMKGNKVVGRTRYSPKVSFKINPR